MRVRGAANRLAQLTVATINVATMLLFSGCLRGVAPLRGEVVPTSLPAVTLPNRPMQLQFSWVYGDDSFSANGDGAIRIAPPDSARLDFFLRNGAAGGFAVLHGDSLFVPGQGVAERLMPPPAMLWAALNRLTLPAARDTVGRVSNDTLRFDVGHLRGVDASSAQGQAWRVALFQSQIVRLDRIESGRIVESVVRSTSRAADTIRYYHEHAHRRLTLVLTDTSWVKGFDAEIWRRH